MKYDNKNLGFSQKNYKMTLEKSLFNFLWLYRSCYVPKTGEKIFKWLLSLKDVALIVLKI